VEDLFFVGNFVSSYCKFSFSFVTLEYRADAAVYIISKSRYGVDPYTVVKSAEQVGQNITQVMKTQDFFDKVMTVVPASFDKSQFQNVSDRVRTKRWQKTVDGSVIFGTGVLNVSAYHHDPAQANILASALVDTLVQKGYEYVGGDVTIKQVNKAIVTRFPVRPNLLLNAVLGFILGLFISAIFLVKKTRSLF
jgi:capsular polysaccharide biosynthesis protein